MDIRPYMETRDFDAVKRIWLEVGWIEDGEEAKALKSHLRIGKSLVGMIDGEAECLVHTVPGNMRCMETDLEMCAVTAVTTSRTARRKGFAKQMTAEQLANGVKDGAEIAVLGIFEQGFYDLVGFGTGSYEHRFSFDPATLLVDKEFRTPKRLTHSSWREVHDAMLHRKRGHGSCVLYPPEIWKAELKWTENGFGLGYYDRKNGKALSHFFWCESKGENGPYHVAALCYENGEQLLELLALIRALADQVSSVTLMEPPDVQFQSLLKQPIRNRRNTRNSTHANSHQSLAWWQLRILDVGACVAARPWAGKPVRFNLELSDPVEPLLENKPWQGVAGDYVVTLGETSKAEAGKQSSLPQLNASVNAFSRVLFGVVTASSASLTDDLEAPEDLLADLDIALLAPPPKPTWDF